MISANRTPISRAILAITMFAHFVIFASQAVAGCNDRCKKLKGAPVIGIKAQKQFLQKSRDMLVVKSSRAAIQMGYSSFELCSSGITPRRVNRGAAQACAPAILSTRDALYYCPSQVKPLQSVRKATKKGFAAYTGCGSLEPLPSITPTPTPTPSVTPIPATLTFGLETGTRLSDVDTIDVVRLTSGTYRAYIAPSSSSFESDTIYYADSADGLTFGARTTVTGIAPSTSLETLTYPGVIRLADGSITMVYEKSRHISSAGVDLNNLMRAVSADGASFSNSPATIIIPGGSVISTNFSADVISTGATSQRMYYTTATGIFAASSNDEGATWSEDGAISLLGISDNYAPYASSPAVVRRDNGTYLLFFVSAPTSDFTASLLIYGAESSDGTTFYAFDTPVFAPDDGFRATDVSAMILPDGRIRLYFTERSTDFDNQSRAVKSLISQ